MELNNCLYINIAVDGTNDNSDNISEHVDMVEVKTEPNKFDELFFVCNNTNMATNHSRQDEVTSESKIQTLIKFKLSL